MSPTSSHYCGLLQDCHKASKEESQGYESEDTSKSVQRIGIISTLELAHMRAYMVSALKTNSSKVAIHLQRNNFFFCYTLIQQAHQSSSHF